MPDRAPWESRLNSIWYSGERCIWLAPLAAMFGVAVRLRRSLYRLRLLPSSRMPVPVIVIGNITVGGTGKTPLVIFLAQRLKALGRKPGVATRGYGRRATATRVVEMTSSVEEVGDEALVLLRRAGVPVCVGRRRAAAAARLVSAGCDLILCDDGLQHLALQRDLEIAMIDGDRGLGNKRLLPAGPLREPVERLDAVGLVVINTPPLQPASYERQGALKMSLIGIQALQIIDGHVKRPLAEFRGRPLHAIAAIGNPGRFFALLRAAGLEIIDHPFPDHHRFGAGELEFGDDLPVLMTEKDAVKCQGTDDHRLWYVPVDAGFDPADERQLLERIAALSGPRGVLPS